MSIPRIFHHVWTSGDEMPEPVLATRRTWIDRHPGWEFRIWTLEDVGWLRNRALFERSETYAQKADIARYEIVHRFGGVYLDTDMECLRPIDGLIERLEFFSARQYDGIVSQRHLRRGAPPSDTPRDRRTAPGIRLLPSSRADLRANRPVAVRQDPEGRTMGAAAGRPYLPFRVLLSVRPIGTVATARLARTRLRGSPLGSQLEGREGAAGPPIGAPASAR